MADESQLSHIQITGDGNVIGDGNVVVLTKQHFTGEYERLRDAYIEPGPVFERVNLEHFVGREWLLAEVDAFLCDHDRGYFILEAEAGVGKTTFLAWLVQQRGYIHHFTELSPGLEGVGAGLKSLAAQLLLGCHLNPYETEGVVPGVAARSDFLFSLLKRASQQRQDGQKVVLVIDALDEAGTPHGQNVLGLPKVLPEGVFVIASQRPVPVTLQVDTATTRRCLLQLSAGSDENQKDMQRFLEQVAAWPGVCEVLEARDYTSQQFVSALLEKCEGLWIYLHYIVHEIERGERSPLVLEALPKGLTQYYLQLFQNWYEQDETQWNEFHLPLLATLAAAQEAVTVRRLLEWSQIDTSEKRVERLLNTDWRPFISITGQEKQARYSFYHTTLREFCAGRVNKKELASAETALIGQLAEETCLAHSRLSDRYLDAWGSLDEGLPGLLQQANCQEVDDGYGLRYLITHLIGASRFAEVHQLLQLEFPRKWEHSFRQSGLESWLSRLLGKKNKRTIRQYDENTWYTAKNKANDIDGYLSDVIRAWRLAEDEFTTGSALSVARQCRYALMVSSITSLSSNLPLTLFPAFVKHGIWEAGQALAIARQILEPAQRSLTLAHLATQLPQDQQLVALREALNVAKGLPGDSNNFEILMKIVPQLATLGCKREVHQLIDALDRTGEKITLWIASAHCLSDSELQTVLEMVLETQMPSGRIQALIQLTPYLSRRMKKTAQQDILSILHRAKQNSGIEIMLNEPESLKAALPHFSRRLIWQLLEVVCKREHLTPGDAKVLAVLAPYISESARKSVADRVIAQMHRRAFENPVDYLSDDYFRAIHFLSPLIPPAERLTVVREALAIGTGWISVGWWVWYLQNRKMFAPSRPWETSDGWIPQGAWASLVWILSPSWRVHVLASLYPYFVDSKRLTRKLTKNLNKVDSAASPKSFIGNLFGWMPTPHLLIESIAGLYPFVSEEDQHNLLGFMLRLIQRISSKSNTLLEKYVLSCLVEDHYPQLLLDTLSVVQPIRDREAQTWAACGLVHYLPESIKPEIMHRVFYEVLRLDHHYRERQKTWAIKRLAPHLPSDLFLQAIQQVTSWSATTSGPEKRFSANALVEMASVVDEQRVGEIFGVVRKLWREGEKAQALSGIVPYLPESLLSEALAEAGTLERGTERARVLVALATRFEGPLKERALADALNALQFGVDKEQRDDILFNVLVQFAELGCFEGALAIAQRIATNEKRVEAFTLLIPQLPLSLLEETLEETIEGISSKRGYSGIIVAFFVRFIKLGLYRKALYVLQQIRVSYFSEHRLKPRQPGWEEIYWQDFKNLDQAAIENLLWREALDKTPKLTQIIGHLPDRLLPELMAKIEDFALRSRTMNRFDAANVEELSEKLAEVGHLNEALRVRKYITEQDALDRSLWSIVVHLPRRTEVEYGRLRELVLDVVNISKAAYYRTAAIEALMPHLLELPREQLYPLWPSIWGSISDRSRDDLLRNIHALSPAIAALGGEQAVAEVFYAIQDVSRWWP
ncbi:MAG: hypothetical protein SXV54_03225 [Chloroflexota bacterium]|nr:hypothetical protein [Chloroflexota bacterium]